MSDMLTIPVEFIRISHENPRQLFDVDALNELAESIRAHGILEPLIVRTVEGGYELIAGERRLRAAQQIELKHVPCVVRDVDERTARELRLLENLQRQDLTPLEEASAIKDILADGGTQAELAKKLGKSQTWISQRLKLLDMPEDVLELIIAGAITPKHALALLPLSPYPKLLETVVDDLVEAINDGDTVTVDGMSEIISGAMSAEDWNWESKEPVTSCSVVQYDPIPYQARHLTAHLDREACEKCQHSRVAKQYGREYKYCLDTACFAVKLQGAKVKFDEYQRQQAKELGVKGEIDTNQLRIDGTVGFKYLGSTGFDEAACETCDKRKKDKAFDKSFVCIDPECYEKKQKEARAAKLKESKDGWSKVLIALDKATLPKQGGELTEPTPWLKRITLKLLCREWEFKDSVNRACKSFGCNHGNAVDVLQDEDLDCVLTRILILGIVDDKVRMGAKPSSALLEDALKVAREGKKKTPREEKEDAEEAAEDYADDVPDCYGDGDSCCDECVTDCQYYEDCKAEIDGGDE